ncbi:MAG: Sec-independent protein translocase subunit TatA [Actinomycetes bacterium]
MLRGLFEGWHGPLLIVVLVLLFGAKRLPDAARGLGRSLRIFKAETEGLRSDSPSQLPASVVEPVTPLSTNADPLSAPPAAPHTPDA